MKNTLVLGVLLSCTIGAYAATFTASRALSSPTEVQTHFTRDSFLRRYLQESVQVKARKNALLTARANYQNAFVDSFLPSFSVSAGGSKTYSRPDNVHSFDEFTHFDTSASAVGSWNVFNMGKSMLSYQDSALTFQQAQISFDDFIDETVLAAVDMYYHLLLRQKLLQVRQADLEINRKQYEQDKVLYDNGLKTRSDLLSSETSYRSSQLSLFSAQSDYANALSAFNVALNQPTETEVTLEDSSEKSVPTLPSLDSDLTSALARRHDVLEKRLELQQQDIAWRLGKLNTMPALSVDVFASTGRGLNRHEWWNYNYGVSAGVSFDLGFLYLDKYRTRQNLWRTHENAYLNFEQFLRGVRDAVVQARNALLLKTKSLEISELRLSAAVQKFEATQTKYKNGLMSATDLTVAQQSMVSAQIDHATLITELETTKLRYLHAIGDPIFDYSLEELP